MIDFFSCVIVQHVSVKLKTKMQIIFMFILHWGICKLACSFFFYNFFSHIYILVFKGFTLEAESFPF